MNAPNPERRVLISHKYFFILAEGSKVIYVHSCLKQIIGHQEENRLAIKIIKHICSCLVVWMQSLNALICQALWHRWDCTSSSCRSQPDAASPVTAVPEGFKGVGGIRAGISPLFLPLTSPELGTVQLERSKICPVWKSCVTKL